MFGKHLNVFFLFLLIAPTSGVQIPQSCLMIDLQNVIFLRSFEAKDGIRIANCVGEIFQQSRKLRNNFHRMYHIVQNLADKGAETVISNPGITNSLLTGGLMVISYYFTAEANHLLLEAGYEKDDLNMLAETEMYPLVKLIDNMMADENSVRNACKAEERLLKLLDRAILKLQTTRKNMEKTIVDSVDDESKSNILQWMSTSAAATSVGVILAAPCAFTAFFACPALMSGTSGLLASIGSYFYFGNNKLTYQEIQERLWNARSEAMAAEKYFRLARFNVEAVCTKVMVSDSNIFIRALWVGVDLTRWFLGFDKKAATKYLQLEEEHHLQDVKEL